MSELEMYRIMVKGSKLENQINCSLNLINGQKPKTRTEYRVYNKLFCQQNKKEPAYEYSKGEFV